MSEAQEIMLDGQAWQTEADFIEAVLAGVGAPSWHGRNYNAIRDSLVSGHINEIDPPYDFIISMPPEPSLELTAGVRHFMDCISDWRGDGARLSARLV